MVGNRQAAPLIAVGVVGAVMVVVLGYVLYNTLTSPQATATIPTPIPAVPDTARTATSTPTPRPPTPTATPTPTETAVPTPTCVDDLALVEHLTFDDQDMVEPPTLRRGSRFNKSWRVQNTGTCTWDPGYSVAYVEGNQVGADMDGAPIVLHGETAPSETYDLEVRLTAPREPGLYQGFWQMRNAAGVYFGDRLPVAIQVLPLPTPGPTDTPRPATTIQFSVDRNRVVAGECALFSWTVTNAQAVYFFSEGEAWQAHGVPFDTQRQACPTQTTTYYLRVVRASGWVETKREVLHVEQPPEAPQIAQFTITPDQVPEGGCADLSWVVEGQVTTVRLLRDSTILWENAPPSAHLRDCPPGSGEKRYTLEAIGPGGTTRAQHTLRIGSTPTPTPQPLSGTEWQVLAIGGSMPAPAAQPLTVLFGLQDAAGQGTVAGWGGCNTYSATYRQSGALLTIGAPTAVGNTCAADVMEQEQALLDALHATATLTRSDGQLTLWNNAQQVLLNLAASEAAAP